jgi:pimeloyl-ACP methyl ester carboxylesterase
MHHTGALSDLFTSVVPTEGLTMAANEPDLIKHREGIRNEAAIVFIHGFGGHPRKTWENFPDFLAKDKQLDGWDIYSIGYHTGLSLDIVSIWTADPQLASLAILLGTRIGIDPLKRYKSFALVAHSMGGLVVQAALLDDKDLRQRTRHLFLFGTPSNGLKKALLFQFWKPQIKDMAEGSGFVSKLRTKWQSEFGTNRTFQSWSIAGDLDQFVPPTSSLAPFAREQQFVIPGDHLSIVKPTGAGSPAVQLVLKGLLGVAAPAGPWNSARVAVEAGQFEDAVAQLEPHQDELDDHGKAQLALAMEGIGRPRERVIEFLEHTLNKKHTDAMGVLGGRYKRRWLVERQEKDFERAFNLYREGYELSAQANRYGQAFYHGINVAFLSFAQHGELNVAHDMANKVLQHCEEVRRHETPGGKPDYWRLATEGEAYLYLNYFGEAMERYRQAVETKPAPRQMDSTYQQALWVTGRMGNEAAALLLQQIFRGAPG